MALFFIWDFLVKCEHSWLVLLSKTYKKPRNFVPSIDDITHAIKHSNDGHVYFHGLFCFFNRWHCSKAGKGDQNIVYFSMFVIMVIGNGWQNLYRFHWYFVKLPRFRLDIRVRLWHSRILYSESWALLDSQKKKRSIKFNHLMCTSYEAWYL